MNPEKDEPLAPPGPLRRLLGAFFYGGFDRIFRFLGTASEARAVRLSMAVNTGVSFFVGRRQRENIARLFPRLPSRERRELQRRHGRYLGRHRVFLARLMHQPVGEVRARVILRGEEHLRAALAQGRGALLVGGHAGTWWHAPARLGVIGCRISTVVNPTLFPPLARFMRELSTRFDIPLTYVNQDAYGAARAAFARGECFFIAMDRTMRPERSLWFPIAGAAVPIDPGPAILALRQRAPVLWVTCYHDDDGQSVVELSPEILIGRGTPLNTPEALLRHWMNCLDRDVQRHPAQWWPISFSSLDDASRLTSAASRPAPTHS